MKIPKPELRKARIEIIPMIDTIFFLLVFFMVSSLSMVKMKGINLAMPRSSPPPGGGAASQAGRPPTLILTVTDSGDYFVNTTPITLASLESSLRQRVAGNPNTVVVLNVAKSQNAQTLIHVMDTVGALKTPSGSGVKILIATEPIDRQGRALAASDTTPATGSQKQ